MEIRLTDLKVKESLMNAEGKSKTLSIPEIALIAVTRGAIGFGAGLLLANKFRGQVRKTLGWSLFLSGLASTVPIAIHLFGKKEEDSTIVQH